MTACRLRWGPYRRKLNKNLDVLIGGGQPKQMFLSFVYTSADKTVSENGMFFAERFWPWSLLKPLLDVAEL